MKKNRRSFLKNSTSLAAALSVGSLNPLTNNKESKGFKTPLGAEWPLKANPRTPKLCVGVSMDADEKTMRRIKQIGVDYVLMGGPKIPWTVDVLKGIMDRFKAQGLTVINMMIGGYPNIIYGREGRDEEIKNVQESLRAAGAVGLPVVEHNFYADRLMEAYYEKPARGGASYTAFD